MKSWKATPKKQCTKCQIIFDKDWTSADKSCPSCHAHVCHQRTLKASDSRARRFTPVTDLQRRIMVAECRLHELSCLRQTHECTPLLNRAANTSGGGGESIDQSYTSGIRNRHNHDLVMLSRYQNEIVQTTAYLSELKVKLKLLSEQTPISATIRYPEGEGACAK